MSPALNQPNLAVPGRPTCCPLSNISDSTLRQKVNDLLFSGALRGEVAIDFRVPVILEGGYARVRVITTGRCPGVVYIRPMFLSCTYADSPFLDDLLPYHTLPQSYSATLPWIGGGVEITNSAPQFGSIHSYNEKVCVAPLLKAGRGPCPSAFSKYKCLASPAEASNPFMTRPVMTLKVYVRRLQISFDSSYAPLGLDMQRRMLQSLAPFVVVSLDGLPVFRTDCVIINEHGHGKRYKYKMLQRSWGISIIFGIQIELCVHSPHSVIEIAVFDKDLNNFILPDLASRLSCFSFPVKTFFYSTGDKPEVANSKFDLQYYQFLLGGASHESAIPLQTRYPTAPSMERDVHLNIQLEVTISPLLPLAISPLFFSCNLLPSAAPMIGTVIGLDFESFKVSASKMITVWKVAGRRWNRYRIRGGMPVALIYMFASYLIFVQPHRWFIPVLFWTCFRLSQSLISIYSVSLHIHDYELDKERVESDQVVLGMTDFKENRKHLSKTVTKSLLSLRAEYKLKKLQDGLAVFVSRLELLATRLNLQSLTHFQMEPLVGTDGKISLPEDLLTVQEKIDYLNDKMEMNRTYVYAFRALRISCLLIGYLLPESVIKWSKLILCFFMSLVVLSIFMSNNFMRYLKIFMRFFGCAVKWMDLKRSL
eukprot:GHVH01005040.1.p1 GENE.GHVH01005040.1~~GHVH01005040.1.p1  ORF type:complete len:650 (+),score=64.69 GHVH01005040.1:627-2576(+)